MPIEVFWESDEKDRLVATCLTAVGMGVAGMIGAPRLEYIVDRNQVQYAPVEQTLTNPCPPAFGWQCPDRPFESYSHMRPTSTITAITALASGSTTVVSSLVDGIWTFER